MRPRPLAGHGHLPAADQPDVGDDVVRGAEGPRGDQGRARVGQAIDAVEARGLGGIGQGHRRQEGGVPPRRRSGEDPTLLRERHHLRFRRVA
jgi:hypothetical protein